MPVQHATVELVLRMRVWLSPRPALAHNLSRHLVIWFNSISRGISWRVALRRFDVVSCNHERFASCSDLYPRPLRVAGKKRFTLAESLNAHTSIFTDFGWLLLWFWYWYRLEVSLLITPRYYSLCLSPSLTAAVPTTAVTRTTFAAQARSLPPTGMLGEFNCRAQPHFTPDWLAQFSPISVSHIDCCVHATHSNPYVLYAGMERNSFLQWLSEFYPLLSPSLPRYSLPPLQGDRCLFHSRLCVYLCRWWLWIPEVLRQACLLSCTSYSCHCYCSNNTTRYVCLYLQLGYIAH